MAIPSRRKQTPLSVRLGDVAARWCITIGGIGTIVAVTAVFAFLAYVVWPLFLPAKISGAKTAGLPKPSATQLRVGLDEYGVIGWSLSDEGILTIFRADTGELIQQQPLELPKSKGPAAAIKITAAAFANDSPGAALGLADGTVRLGQIGFRTSFVEAAKVPEALRTLPIGQRAILRDGVVERTRQGQFRLQQVDAKFHEPIRVSTSPIVLIDQVAEGGKSIFCVLTGDGKLLLEQVTERKNQLTGEVALKARKTGLPYKARDGQAPRHLLLTGQGENVLLAWESGDGVRIDARNLSAPVVAEELRLIADPAAKLTALAPLIGRRTILVGDSRGQLTAWFGTRGTDVRTSDGIHLVAAHDLPRGPAAVTALGASARSRLALAGYADGRTRLFNVTTESMMIESAATGQPVTEAAIGVKNDRLYAVSDNRLWSANFNPRYPEVSWSSLMLPVHYEDYPGAEHVWQSSGGTVDFEPKLGFRPLIFGTLKATCYSMLFGAPLALLAALYASEFMHPRWRARVKPTIELMASMPSVVLGFLAGNVLAQLVQGIVPQVITIFFTVPFVILLGAFVWQLIPQRRLVMWQRWRFPLIGLLAVPLGVLTGWGLGPAVERVFFAGDIMRWLDGQIGTGFGAWVLLLLPLSAVGTAICVGLFVNPWLARRAFSSRSRLAWVNLLKFILGSAVALLAAMGVSALLTHGGNWAFGGLDPRGTYVGTYVQRNALIVGFMMGFAIIPIIYTIAEDALSTVPDHLRSASLGAGATQWQTAVRIVVPAATSGLFSAVMVGLGRAVGETMIMLMATGNVPIMKWNIFDGFRTLSATIAVEMPEAPAGSMHYRVLFLTALTLFLMTFVVNTAAEIVRLRFRKRALQM